MQLEIERLDKNISDAMAYLRALEWVLPLDSACSYKRGRALLVAHAIDALAEAKGALTGQTFLPVKKIH